MGNILKPHQVSYTNRPNGKKTHGHHHISSAGRGKHCGPRLVSYYNHTMRSHQIAELIAACTARGLDPRTSRTALELATDKGVRKLAHGFLC